MRFSGCFGGGDRVTAAGLGLPKTFTVIRELGSGNEGRTYLVRERTKRGTELFALKAIPRGNLLHSDFVLRGLRNQSSLCFVHVVKFLEVLLTHSHLLIKFEYVDGGDLFRYVCRQRFVSRSQLMDEEHVRFLFMQIVLALHHCHNHRIAHRDMKFQNALCTRSKHPCVKISDFGLSKAWENPRDAVSFSVVGSLPFMSPSIVLSRSVPNQEKPYDLCKSDVWALGVILYTMLFGRFPFMDPSLEQSHVSRPHVITESTASFSVLLSRMEFIHQTNPQRLTKEIKQSTLSPGAKRLLLSMLETDEEKRIGLDDLIAHDWVHEGLSVSRALAMNAFEEQRETDSHSIPYEHAELVLGSPADQELERITRLAARVGEAGEQIIRWLPPGVRLTNGMTERELEELARQGIRRCSKCRLDAEDCVILRGIRIRR